MNRLTSGLARFLAILPGTTSHTVPLLVCMGGVLLACAWLLGGVGMVVSALIAVVLMLMLSPMMSPEFLMRLLRAKPVEPGAHPAIYEMVRLLAERAGLSHVPRLYFLPGPGVNAITTGTPNDTIIALSDQAMRQLSPRQIRAVLAHEIAHAWHGDTRILVVCDIFYRATWTIALFGLFVFIFSHANPPVWVVIVFGFVPTISFLLQRAVIRDREFAADHGASELLAGPEDMIDALEHIDAINRRSLRLVPYRSTQPPAILDTHPSIKTRIEALRALKPHIWQGFFKTGH
jgi:heat shock protein HtpX